MAFLQSTQYGAQLVSTNVWDPSNIYASDLDPELKEILVFMYQNLNRMAQVINVKETGQYNDSFPTLNNQQWFANPANNSTTMANAAQRNVFRTVINFGQLPNATTKSVPHYITCTSETTFTRIYATASDTTGLTYISIPFVDITGVVGSIQLDVNSTNINITTTLNASNYNICYVVAEYILS